MQSFHIFHSLLCLAEESKPSSLFVGLTQSTISPISPLLLRHLETTILAKTAAEIWTSATQATSCVWEDAYATRRVPARQATTEIAAIATSQECPTLHEAPTNALRHAHATLQGTFPALDERLATLDTTLEAWVEYAVETPDARLAKLYNRTAQTFEALDERLAAAPLAAGQVFATTLWCRSTNARSATATACEAFGKRSATTNEALGNRTAQTLETLDERLATAPLAARQVFAAALWFRNVTATIEACKALGERSATTPKALGKKTKDAMKASEDRTMKAREVLEEDEWATNLGIATCSIQIFRLFHCSIVVIIIRVPFNIVHHGNQLVFQCRVAHCVQFKET